MAPAKALPVLPPLAIQVVHNRTMVAFSTDDMSSINSRIKVSGTVRLPAEGGVAAWWYRPALRPFAGESGQRVPPHTAHPAGRPCGDSNTDANIVYGESRASTAVLL